MKSEVDADTFTPRPIFTPLLNAASLCAQVLREVGMKGEVDADTFRLCAQRVAESYAAAPDSHAPEAAAGAAMKAAEMLAAHLAAKADDLFAPHLFHMLGAIAFVPATQVRLVSNDQISVVMCLSAFRLRSTLDVTAGSQGNAVRLILTQTGLVSCMRLQTISCICKSRHAPWPQVGLPGWRRRNRNALQVCVLAAVRLADAAEHTMPKCRQSEILMNQLRCQTTRNCLANCFVPAEFLTVTGISSCAGDARPGCGPPAS